MKNHTTRRKGFTLIELIVVVAIIGTLTSIGVYGYQKSVSRSRDQRRQADLGLIQSALENYKSEKDTYPSTDYTGLCALVPNYISSLPYDPKATNPCQTGERFSEHDYSYSPSCTANICKSYTLSATLEATSGTYSVDQDGVVVTTAPQLSPSPTQPPKGQENQENQDGPGDLNQSF